LRSELLEWSEQHRACTPPSDKDRQAPPVRNGVAGNRPPRCHIPQDWRAGPSVEREPQRPGRPLLRVRSRLFACRKRS
jgi:hypothetical protein